jgi:hypothetical protein
MSPGYLVRALNEFASLTCVMRREGCDAFGYEMRQKGKSSQEKKIDPERQKFRTYYKVSKISVSVMASC